MSNLDWINILIRLRGGKKCRSNPCKTAANESEWQKSKPQDCFHRGNLTLIYGEKYSKLRADQQISREIYQSMEPTQITMDVIRGSVDNRTFRGSRSLNSVCNTSLRTPHGEKACLKQSVLDVWFFVLRAKGWAGQPNARSRNCGRGRNERAVRLPGHLERVPAVALRFGRLMP
jgi:hypothetical protein